MGGKSWSLEATITKFIPRLLQCHTLFSFGKAQPIFYSHFLIKSLHYRFRISIDIFFKKQQRMEVFMVNIYLKTPPKRKHHEKIFGSEKINSLLNFQI